MMHLDVYQSLSGALVHERKLEIIANNLANANTSGYKADVLIEGSFRSELDDAMLDDQIPDMTTEMDEAPAMPGIYGKTQGVAINFGQGQLKYNGNPLSLALQGPGFFVVETPQGERYTRSGNFSLNSDGELTTAEGHRVKGRGLSNLDSGAELSFDSLGNVLVDGVVQGRLKIVEFADTGILEKAGDSLFVPRVKGDFAEDARGTTVMQGRSEMANVDVVNEMVNMITVNRIYEAYQKAITTSSEMSKQLMADVAR